MENESKKMLEDAGIPTTGGETSSTKEGAVTLADKLGYPVVMKVLSPDIIHKSDSGGVKLNLNSSGEVESAYDEIMSSALKVTTKDKIAGVTVQKMAPQGVEIIIGMSKDPQFGAAMMFGLGGVLVEVLKDVSFRIVPITRYDAVEMIHEIKGYPILEGYRGSQAVDQEKLIELLLKTSDFIESHPEIDELDLNPVFAYADSVIVADARVILAQ